MRWCLQSALALLALVTCAACAGRVEPVVDLTPWTWTWSQQALGGWMIRYAYPDEPSESQQAGATKALAGDPVIAAMLPDAMRGLPSPERSDPPGATRFASFRYGCAREDRAEDAPCSVFLDFWLLALEPPLADSSVPVYEDRFARAFASPTPYADGVTRDSRDREWLKRTLAFESGAAFSHYSRPLSPRVALAVTSYTTRAPDRVVARDLARDAIERVRIEAASGPAR